MDSPASRMFEGTSSTTNFDEALAAALQQAQEAAAPDELLNWELVATHGLHGGLPGWQQLTVVIRLVGSVQQSVAAAAIAPGAEADPAHKSLNVMAAFEASETHAADAAEDAPAVITLRGAAGTPIQVALAANPGNESFAQEVHGPQLVLGGKYNNVGPAPGTHQFVFSFFRRPWQAAIEARVGAKVQRLDASSKGAAGVLAEPDMWRVVVQAQS